MGYLTVTRLIAMIAPRLHSTGAVWLAGTEQAEFRRRGRVVEGTPLLREHLGQNLDRGFESLRLRQQWRRNPKRSRSLGVLFFPGPFLIRRVGFRCGRYVFAHARMNMLRMPKQCVVSG